MSTPYIAQISVFGFSFTPRGWAMCNGQLLPISQNTALFSILGTTYGGNGTSNFALPDLRDRAPMHSGTGPGLSPRTLGQVLGEDNHTLTVSEMPTHTHAVGITSPLPASTAIGDGSSASGQIPAVTGRPLYADSSDGSMGAPVVSPAGGSQPHSNVQPYLCLNLCIALQGIFPSRN